MRSFAQLYRSMMLLSKRRDIPMGIRLDSVEALRSAGFPRDVRGSRYFPSADSASQSSHSLYMCSPHRMHLRMVLPST